VSLIQSVLYAECRYAEWYGVSTNPIGRQPKSCLGRVFHFKLASFVVMNKVNDTNERPCLKLKNQQRFHSLA
jgi:hypothetical protein